MSTGPAGDRRTPFALLFGQAALGLVVGVVWWLLTRHPAPWVVGEPVVTSSSVYPVARDGVFSVLTALVGLAAGVVVVARGSRDARPLLVLGTALAGALAGALIAAGLGSSLPPAGQGEVGHVTVRAWVVLLVQPFALTAVVAVVTLVQALLEWARTA
ncbi:hypothetical protein [Kineococcus aurantiacus]|uniref:DUF2567 domain-containing protein n=1 Tax=Kineococcus aurantiacus TaxID=37633 RepID=A0A7Y9ASN9_9ACTN|nr:hypothetical protein [Kineococcus aurantiacus]NYD21019.1 hypothetical protein [Kineococcus aurantiacus]